MEGKAEKKSKLIDKSFVMILKEEGGKKKILITRLNRARDRKNYFGKSTSLVDSIIPRDYSVKPSGTTSTSTFNVPSIIA